MKAKKSLSNIFAYLQGNIRYKLYYSKNFSFLLRNHIHEQIDARINSMDRQCYIQGSCKICGCATTALQMADKACPKPCYPEMMGRKAWTLFKMGFPKKNLIGWVFNESSNKFIKQ